jgi:hypothetical protein
VINLKTAKALGLEVAVVGPLLQATRSVPIVFTNVPDPVYRAAVLFRRTRCARALGRSFRFDFLIEVFLVTAPP